jgi:hypothetical protein
MPPEAAAAAEIDPFEAAFSEAAKDTVATAAAPVVVPVPEPERLVTIVEGDAAAAKAASDAAEAAAKAVAAAAPAAPVEGAQAAEGLELPDPAAPAVPEADKAAADAAAAAAKANDDFMKRFGALMEAAKPAPAADTRQPQPQPTEPALFSEAEATQLQAFYTEWPDVAQAAQVMMRGMVTQMSRRLMADMAGTLAPYLQTIDALATNSQVNELEAKVPGYDKVIDQLIPWVEKQPKYLQPAYQHVIQQGTSDEVIDLIERFKRETGSPAAATPQAPVGGAASPAPQSVKKVTELSPAARQAAAALAPISSKRANASSVMIGSQDFDGAFAEAVRSA